MKAKNNSKIRKDWKYYLGIALFIYSFIPYLVAGLFLFFNIPLGELLEIMAAFIVSAEIAFAICIVLLGERFVKALNRKFKKFFRHKKISPTKPISRTRHHVGVTLLFVSLLPCFVIELLLFFGFPRTESWRVFMLLFLLSGDAIFIISLFVLGEQFWDRLKKLFQWPGNSKTIKA